jgi:deazaflavin-dependent oxidoreductase (nitroreductase family)
MATITRKLRARALKAFFALHRELYERSDGRLGARMQGFDMLLLTTRGRSSGKPRTTPLVYFVDNGSYVVVGSDGGARRDPQWWKNLLVDPNARLRVGRRVIEARARLATGAERARLWETGKGVNPNWDRYQRSCPRELPVVLFDPIA